MTDTAFHRRVMCLSMGLSKLMFLWYRFLNNITCGMNVGETYCLAPKYEFDLDIGIDG